MKEIKFLDLTAQYPLIRDEIQKRWQATIDRSAFVAGAQVKEFEAAFASFCGVKHCIAVDNGTSALLLALWAQGIGPGDEVILPVNTFIATAEAVSLLGAKPVLVDIDEQTFLIDATQIESKITNRTKAIIPVHLYGQCADMESVNDIARRHNLTVVEDACQAHGALYQGRRAGSLGASAAFSFYPGKNLGAWGEAGAVTTNDDAIAEKIRLLRDHGSPVKYEHSVVGGNFRLDELQGAVLAVKLPYLDKWNETRRQNAEQYKKLLTSVESVILPAVAESNTPVWHLFVVRVKNREAAIKQLKEQGIQTGIHYPTPLHLTEAYRHLGYKAGDFPVAERVQVEILSLPMYAELNQEDIAYVAAQLGN